MGATLPKAERLCGRTAVSSLMKGGKWLNGDNLRCCFAPNGLEFSRVMVSVPKKHFKRAVKRNLLKRRMRESYRLQKDLVGGGFDVLFVYIGTEAAPFEEIRTELASLLARISQK
ncbi:MAG: ribonuclease P protein component [Bacteroidales bacterium]|nr:ribonuclease P protein component [Bacteroidales bacterium]